MTLTDRERSALTVLRDEGRELHPGRVGYLAGDTRPRASRGWRNTLGALERKGLVRGSYIATHGHSALFRITKEGLEALRA